MSITLAAQSFDQAPSFAAACASVAHPTPSPSPPSTASSSTPASPVSATPVFHLQLTAASTTSLAIEPRLGSPAPTPAGEVRGDDDDDGDADETGSTTSELPYPACDLKRVRFPCPIAEAERFASLHVTYSPAEYDRTPILISEEGRSCVLPERGSKRCYFYSPDLDGGLVVDDELAASSDDDADGSAEEGESDESAADASAVSADEDEMMDRRIAMMRSMGLAVAAGLAAAIDDTDSLGRRSPSGGENVSAIDAEVEAEDRSLGPDGQKELDHELIRIRERCRTRFGLWRVETAEFASEDPNACSSPREPCTPNPSPMSPPMALGGSFDGQTTDGNSPTPPAVVAASSYSYFGVPPSDRRRSSASSTRPIAIPARSASGSSATAAAGASGSGSSSIDGPASATPTSSLVGLSIPRRMPSRDDDEKDDGDETGSPSSLGAASPATRRMMWCQMMRSGPLPTAYTADDSDEEDEEPAARQPAHRLEDEEEHQDESRGMRRWLFDGSTGGRVVSDSPPPTPGWDDVASSFLAGAVGGSSSSASNRPALARSSGAGFPFTRVRSLPASSSSSASSSTASSPPPTATGFTAADRDGSSSTVHLLGGSRPTCTLAFAKKSPPATPSAPTASLLRSALAPSPPAPIDTAVTPTAVAEATSEASSTPTATAATAVGLSSSSTSATDLLAGRSLHLLASPSSSACSSTDTFLTDSDPPSLVSLASCFSSGSSGSSEHGEPTDLGGLSDRWDLHAELARSPGFRLPLAASAATVDKRDDVFGGWSAGAEASEYLLGSRDIW